MAGPGLTNSPTRGLAYGSGLIYPIFTSGPVGPQAMIFNKASNSMYLALLKPVEVGFLVAGIAKILLALLGKIGVFPYA